MHRRITRAILATLLALTAAPAFAYVGPGAGLSMLGALWGLLVAVIAAVAFVVAWPLRRLFRKARGQKETGDAAQPEVSGQSGPAEREQGQGASAESHGRS